MVKTTVIGCVSVMIPRLVVALSWFAAVTLAVTAAVVVELVLPGQSVCRNGLLITVDGKAVGTALAHDSRGRALPVWQGCRLLARDEVFLMNVDQAASLDIRYFGPIPFTAIVRRAVPLWTLGGQS